MRAASVNYRAIPAIVPALLAMLAACGQDRFEPWQLDELGASEGFTIRVPEFELPSNRESQNCYFMRVPDIAAGNDVWINRVLTAINPGSHHMNVFRVATIVNLDGEPGDMVENGECFKSPNWADWPLVANSQNSDPADPYTDWQLPATVAHRFVPGEKLMVQVHYVNAGSQDTPFGAKAGFNFYASPDLAPMELGTLFATQQSIRICQSTPQPSYSGACAFGDAAVTVVAANGHFHSRGERFSMFAWDGVSAAQPPAEARFYESQEWAEPVMATSLDLGVPGGGGVWWTCDYQWFPPIEPYACDDVDARDPEGAGDCCYTFGGLVETSEHCNAFVYYYPKTADVFCN
jgi:hypothetical protein